MNEEDFDHLITGTNRDDKLNRILPQLSCSYCPPNRNENANHHEAKNRLVNKPKKQIRKDRKQARENGRKSYDN